MSSHILQRVLGITSTSRHAVGAKSELSPSARGFGEVIQFRVLGKDKVISLPGILRIEFKSSSARSFTPVTPR